MMISSPWVEHLCGLHDQGHEVHVGYQTSGNIAVTDEFVTRFIDFAVGFESMFGIDNKRSTEILSQRQKISERKKIFRRRFCRNPEYKRIDPTK